MTDKHPITPPDELKKQWMDLALSWQETLNIAAQWGADQQLKLDAEQIAQAYQAGADQELEACCEVLRGEFNYSYLADPLRADRRPKPPSLRKQAYDALDTYIYGEPDPKDKERTYNAIRQALEALPND